MTLSDNKLEEMNRKHLVERIRDLEVQCHYYRTVLEKYADDKTFNSIIFPKDYIAPEDTSLIKYIVVPRQFYITDWAKEALKRAYFFSLVENPLPREKPPEQVSEHYKFWYGDDDDD